MSGGFRLIHGRPLGRGAAGPAGRRARRRSRRSPAGSARVPGRATSAGCARTRRPARTRPSAPVVACWDGRIVAVGPRAARRGRRRGGWPARSPGSPGWTPAGGSVTPGLVDPHTHLLFGGVPRGRAGPAPAGGGVSRHPRRRRRDPLDGGRDPRRRRPTTCSPMAAAGSTRCSPTASRPSRRSPATAWTSRPRSGWWTSPFRLGAEGPIDVVPTFLGAHAVAARVPRPARTARRPTSARSSRSSSPASRPTAARASATSSARTASSARTSRAGS